MSIQGIGRSTEHLVGLHGPVDCHSIGPLSALRRGGGKRGQEGGGVERTFSQTRDGESDDRVKEHKKEAVEDLRCQEE